MLTSSQHSSVGNTDFIPISQKRKLTLTEAPHTPPAHVAGEWQERGQTQLRLISVTSGTPPTCGLRIINFPNKWLLQREYVSGQ